MQVPTVMQMEALECGAASLAMILAYHGKWISLEQVRQACGVSRDGTTALSIVRAATSYGLQAEGYKMTTEALAELQLPAILHWNFNHYVVFCGIRGDHAVINDPISGPRRVGLDDFKRQFTGVVLTFQLSAEFQPEGGPVSIYSYIKNYLSGAREAFWLTLVFSLLAACVTITVPLLLGVFLDEILPGTGADWAHWFLWGIAGIAVFAFVLELLKDLYLRRVSGSLALKSSVGYLRHLLRLPMNFFAMRYVGDLQQRAHLNERITQSLVGVLAPQLVNITLVVLYLVLMLTYSAPLALIGVVAALLNLVLIVRFARRRVNLIRSMEQSEGKYYSTTVSCIDNMESIKAAGAETGFFEYWSGLWARKFNVANDADDQEIRMGVIPILIEGLVNAAVLVMGAVFILQGQLTIGMLMAFQGVMGSFLEPVGEMVSASQQIIEMRSQMERVDDVMKYPEEHQANSGQTAEGKLGGRLELRHVTFGYSPLQPPLISDFNLLLEPGQSVAFVGSSGCGKSTLAKLISGLYKPWSGEILFDGRPIESISREELTNSVAVIDQNVVLFDDTVAQNIRMWDNSIEDFTMMMACNDAQIRADIVSRPEGFATRLIRGGQNFSGGQRQRMEIATALAKEPVVLVMDEATAALDPKTEDEVMTAIRMTGATQIVIAHRLSTIRDCDQIMVLDQGKVVQQGTHDELMAQPGMYQDLMNSE